MAACLKGNTGSDVCSLTSIKFALFIGAESGIQRVAGRLSSFEVNANALP